MTHSYFLNKKLRVVNIPYKILEMNKDMPAAMQENWHEIERLLQELQIDINSLSEVGLPGSDITSGTITAYTDGVKILIFAKNNHLMIDPWGINPDFIKRVQNLIKNSGFEWYDPVTLVPRDWTGDGVVDTTEKWEGEASLKLAAGEKMRVTESIEHDGNQQRVSFRHKGGAVRVRVKR